MIYVLDTDIAGYWQQGHPVVLAHARSLPPGTEVVSTVITFGEDLSGWLPACRRAKNGDERILAYQRLNNGLTFYRQIACLPFNKTAAQIFDQLRKQDKQIGTNDLAIAAIVLAVNGIVVTRNIADFSRVPNLVIEDWAK
ncbi:MAG: type II toxin-antitoxin system VapC family toxin [Acidobacteria bacterium]|nr:type II toxin-antitoxin system VapC family toxin [Acidobacteriota bacterium]